jgi:hypothetical protein
MKKTLAIIAMVVGAGTMNAQLTSKKGENYLPQSGDWSIGIDGSSALGYFGNMLNNSADNGMSFDFSNAAQMITGKLFINDNTAYRAALRIGMGSASSQVASLDSIGAFDDVKSSGSFIGIGGGIEKRRGTTRLQGYYGGMAMLAFQNGKTETTYVKPNQVGDITATTDGANIGFGVRGFIGVEYFVLPKISIGGEFGWGLMFSKAGAGSTTAVTLDANGNTTSTTTDGASSSSFPVDTDNAAFGMSPAAVMINFHF